MLDYVMLLIICIAGVGVSFQYSIEPAYAELQLAQNNLDLTSQTILKTKNEIVDAQVQIAQIKSEIIRLRMQHTTNSNEQYYLLLDHISDITILLFLATILTLFLIWYLWKKLK